MKLSSCSIATISTCNLLLGANAFSSILQSTSVHRLKEHSPEPTTSIANSKNVASSWTTSTTLYLAQDKKYSAEVRLREEAEAPFRKVRFFGYATLLGGAFISLLVSATRIVAGLNGINTDLLEESLTNAAIDAAGIVVLSFLFKNDIDAEESRLRRASKGAELANLPVRGKAAFFLDQEQKNYSTLTLAAFRAGRGIDKRIVICAAGEDTISSVVNEMMMSTSLQDALVANDLVVIPVVIPEGTAPAGIDDELLEKECIAIPNGRGWKSFIAEEVEEASKQGLEVSTKGFALILKKNGKVGQRTSGINLGRMVGEVVDRQEMGMDVTNI